MSLDIIVFHYFNYKLYFSAAKAPYLARFRVRKCGINELEQTAMAISNLQTTGNNDKVIESSSMMGLDTWQAAIFKVKYIIK